MLINGLQPTSKTSPEVLNDFKNISNPGPVTYGAVVTFVDDDFTGEGRELEADPLPSDYNPSPPFLNNITLALPKAFAQTVHGFWSQLIRSANETALCNGQCESSFIHLNHSFVIPGLSSDYQYTH